MASGDDENRKLNFLTCISPSPSKKRKIAHFRRQINVGYSEIRICQRQSLLSETGDFQETFYEMLEETLDPDVNILDFSCYSQNFENIDYDLASRPML